MFPETADETIDKIRHARRELKLVNDELAREREQLERVRTVLAGQRLVMAANDDHIGHWREDAVAERARLGAEVADLSDRRAALERELARRNGELDSTLGRRQADLAAQVLALESRRGQLDGEISARLAELGAEIDRAKAAALAESERANAAAVQQAEHVLSSARQDADQVRLSASQQAGRLLGDAETNIANRRGEAERQSAEQLESARQARAQADQLQVLGQQEFDRIVTAAEGEIGLRRQEAQRQVDASLASARQEGETSLASARQEGDAIRQSAEQDAWHSHQSGQQQADELIQSAKAASAKSAGEVQALLSLARTTIENANKASAEERDRLARESARRIAEADAASASADADLARRRVAFERETAEVRKRIALLDSDDARIAYEKSKLAEQKIDVARDLEDQARRRGELTAAEKKLQSAEIAFAHNQAQVEGDLVRRSADADSTAAALEELEQTLSRRMAEFEQSQATRTADFEQAMAKRTAEFEQSAAQRTAEFERSAAKWTADFEQSTSQRSAELEQSTTQRRAELEQSLAQRRSALEEALAQSRQELEQSVTQRRGELDRRQSAIDEARETLQRQQDGFEQDRRARLADLEGMEREAAATREATVARRQEAEALAQEEERGLGEIKSELTRLRQEQDSLRREQELLRHERELSQQQRAEAERATGEMEAQRDRLRTAEREVLGGWDEIRRGQAAVAKSREQLDRERKEFAAAARPPAPVIKMVQRRLGRGTYRKWAAGLAITTAAALLVTELTVVTVVKPVCESVQRTTLTVTECGDEAAVTVAMKEFAAYLADKHSPVLEKTGTRIACPDVRVEALAPERSGDQAVLVLHARAESDERALELANNLPAEYRQWRDAKLRLIGQADPSISADELKRTRDSRKADSDRDGDAKLQAWRGILDRAGLDERSATTQGDVRLAVEGKLRRMEDRLDGDERELAKTAAVQRRSRAEAEQIRAIVPAHSPADKKAVQASLNQDRTILTRTKGLLAERTAKAQADLVAAQAEWDKASAAMVDLLAGGEKSPATQPGDQATVVRRFEKAQSAYADALSAVDARQNPLLKTWSDQVADLTDRIAAGERLLAGIVEAEAQADRLAQADKSLKDSTDKLKLLSAQVEQQRAEVVQQRALRLELAASLEVYDGLLRQADESGRKFRQIEGLLNQAQGITTAHVRLTPEPAEIDTAASHNPRPAWMLTAGAIVLLVSAAAGWLILLLLSRPGPIEELPAGPASLGQAATAR